MIKNAINADLKSALLEGDKVLATTLRTIKSVILDAEISKGIRDVGLDDESVINLLIKELKKRQDAADIYKNAGDKDRADKELLESIVISKYLPKMLDEADIKAVVLEVVSSIEDASIKNMGQIIGQVKSKTGPLADGATIARLVKAEIEAKA